jgi:hypothetical protein
MSSTRSNTAAKNAAATQHKIATQRAADQRRRHQIWLAATGIGLLVIALSRFGTFTGLGLTKSDSADVYPNTNTFTFLNAEYTSEYLAFDPVELQDTNHETLQTPTAAQSQLLATYDVAPYTSAPDSIPFIDFGNQFVVNGASYNPQLLQNQSWNTIAAALSDPSSPIAKSVDGTANRLTAAICKMTGDQPPNVCSAPAVANLKAGL